MEQPRRRFIPGPGTLLLATILLGVVGALLHDFRGVDIGRMGALLWGGGVFITFVLGTIHLSRRVLPLQGNVGWSEGFRLLWRSYLMGVHDFLAGVRHEPMASSGKPKKPETNAQSPSFAMLGAGFLFSHEAAAITRGNSFARADGPGLILLQPGESLAQVFDLRTQSRKQAVEATTRDGIPVKTSVSVSFHVRRLPADVRKPRSVETDDIPYPYDRSALFDLNYAGSIVSEEKRLGWADQVAPQAATLLVGELGRYTLDQLLVSGGVEPMNEIKANIKRGLEEMQGSEEGPTLPKGITFASVSVGGLELLPDVVTKRLDSWQSEWHARATRTIAEGDLETQRLIHQARAHVLTESIDGLLASIEAIQANSPSQMHELIVTQFIEALETISSGQIVNTMPQSTQLLSLASDTTREMRDVLEREE